MAPRLNLPLLQLHRDLAHPFEGFPLGIFERPVLAAEARDDGTLIAVAIQTQMVL